MVTPPIEPGHEPERRETIDAEVVDAEIVGAPKPVPRWKSLLVRAGLAVALGAIGLSLLAVGVVFTLTIVGAAIGIPLMLAGLGLLAAAAFVLLGGGRVIVARPPFR
ncbi:MAG: hypothetical protein HY078_02130 [Elusimicrobia bacterium]|nr:hypothetical protein [Elusimicrobiota bacterium]